LASSRDTRNGPDWRDVAQAILNYQGFWCARCEIVVTAEHGTKTGDLIVTARALKDSDTAPGPVVLASASVSARSQNYVSLESVVMKALFDCDVAMYRGESYE
jgi:hypothetical protein